MGQRYVGEHADHDESPHVVIEPGNFPYPILEHGSESRQLVWIRNHANYMARRGWLDYVRAISVLVRGAIVNVLIAAPFLLLFALGVATLSVYGWGFGIAVALIVTAIVWVVAAPIVNRLWGVARINQTIAVGSNTSVGARDRAERTFGLVVIFIFVAATIESLSYFLDGFHFWIREQQWDARALASAATFFLGFVATAGRVLPRLGGKAFKAATVVVGLVGTLLPLVAVMFIADFLVYTGPTTAVVYGVVIAGFGLWVIVAIGIVVAIRSRVDSTAGASAALKTRAVSLATVAVAALLLVIALVPQLVALSAANEVDDRRLSFDADLAALDLAWNSVPELRVREDLDVENSPGEEITVHPVNDKDFRKRQTQFDRLVENAVSRPLPAVSTLADFIGGARNEAESLASFLGLPSPEGSSSFDDVTPDLVSAASFLPGVLCLVTSLELVGPGEAEPCCLLFVGEDGCPVLGDVEDEASVEDQIAQFDFRVGIVAGTLQVAFAQSTSVDRGGPDADSVTVPSGELSIAVEEVVREVLITFDERIIQEELDPFGDWTCFDGLTEAFSFFSLELAQDKIRAVLDPFGTRQCFDALAAAYPFSFELARDEIQGMGRLLRDVRIGVNEVAVFSSQYPELRKSAGVANLRWSRLWSSAAFSLSLATLLIAYAWLALDPNRTSLHGLYRDRLAAAFLVGADTKGDVDVEEDLDLDELSRHEAHSTAPYHLINAAVNLPSSKNIGIHDRRSDFFVFSKRFIGSEQTGYCRSETMERAFPDMSLSTAMAVSGAAASPTMGRTTQPALVALMTMLNVRLGFWMPNPGKLEEQAGKSPKPVKRHEDDFGFHPSDVIRRERDEIERRWRELPHAADRAVSDGLLGLAFSGGGIRSATLNLGITQALHQAGVFDHVDYMSTVSGGGFLGSSISSAMRSRVSTRSEVDGTVGLVEVDKEGGVTVALDPIPKDELPRSQRRDDYDETRREYLFGGGAIPAVKSGQRIAAGKRLLILGDPDVVEPVGDGIRTFRRPFRSDGPSSPVRQQFRWRVQPWSLLREFAGKMDERSRWVNVSDGGHIENLGVFELLRRRCKFIVVGDAEYDPLHQFGGLTMLMRSARLELGARIKIDLGPLRPDEHGHCPRHWVIGRIKYADDSEGHILYLKSSFTGREDEDIVGYWTKNAKFPHEPTSDQFFDEGQFEAYRRLGYHIAREALETYEPFREHLKIGRDECPSIPFSEVGAWFDLLHDAETARNASNGSAAVEAPAPGISTSEVPAADQAPPVGTPARIPGLAGVSPAIRRRLAERVAAQVAEGRVRRAARRIVPRRRSTR